jgi:hypothetical protein
METTTRDIGLIAHAGPVDDIRNQCYKYDAIIDNSNARALAQFLKRVTFSTVERHATSQDEAYQMMEALNAVRRAINSAGFDPR